MVQAKPTVIVTGGTGFLGSHLLRSLIEHNYTVIALKRSWSNTWRINDLLPSIMVHDIDKVSLREIFLDRPIDFLIHAATSYGRKGELTSQIIESNLLFPIKLFELCAEFNVGTFFNMDTFFNVETTLPGGLSEYVLSKKNLIDYVSRSEHLNKIRFANIRAEHIYGPGDDDKKFIPHLIDGFLKNISSIDLTGGKQRRDFIYVDDVVNALLTLISHHAALPKRLVQIGLGTGSSELLSTLVELVRTLCNSSTELRFGKLPYREGEIMDSQADTTILKDLGWSPAISLFEGLSRTVSEMSTARNIC